MPSFYLLNVTEPAQSRLLGTPVLKSQEGLPGPLLRAASCVSPKRQVRALAATSIPTHPHSQQSEHLPRSRWARSSASPVHAMESGSFKSKALLENNPLWPSPRHPPPLRPSLTSVKHMLNSLELLAFSPCSCGREGASKDGSLGLGLWPGFVP